VVLTSTVCGWSLGLSAVYVAGFILGAFSFGLLVSGCELRSLGQQLYVANVLQKCGVTENHLQSIFIFANSLAQILLSLDMKRIFSHR
jgi:hypothetical protein